MSLESATAKQVDETLKNPGFEDVTEDEAPADWRKPNISGLVFRSDGSDVQEGDRSLLLDTTNATLPESNFVAISQTLDAKDFRGKKLKFRAYVKTSDTSPAAQAQLWMRVDLENQQIGAFDNMQDRPILSGDWKPYEIVLKIDDNAKQIIAGLIVIGKCKVRLDSLSLEVVDDDTKTTDTKSNQTSGSDDSKSNKSTSRARPPMSPLVMKAFGEAEKAPKQPFFNHWLWLPLIAIILFGLSALPDKETEIVTDGQRSTVRVSGEVAKFAFRFSFAYWLLYNWSFLIASIIPVYGMPVRNWHQMSLARISQWIANNCLGIEGELVPNNGSGDTTQGYVMALFLFLLAITAAITWTVSDRQPTNHRTLKDLLRSYLRYVLAFWMLSYGLAKVGLYGNQFSPISEFQFNKYWGDSSPMNVVWSFMGTSAAYTFFAGMGEVIGGLLLVWRRTATLGALVTLGVMTNVMMLNYCYDIPVKLFSTHLVFMALFILLFDFKRLFNLLFLHRAIEKQDLRPPYTNGVTIWIQRAIKLAILIIAVGMPIYRHISTQYGFYKQQANLPEYFGQYEIVEYKLDDKVIDQSQDDRGWRSVRFCLAAEFGPNGLFLSEKMFVGMNKVRGRLSASLTIDEDPYVLLVSDSSGGLLPTDKIVVTRVDDEQIRINGMTTAGPLEVLLKRNDNIYRVTGRGYRWINEVPFNR